MDDLVENPDTAELLAKLVPQLIEKHKLRSVIKRIDGLRYKKRFCGVWIDLKINPKRSKKVEKFIEEMVEACLKQSRGKVAPAITRGDNFVIIGV